MKVLPVSSEGREGGSPEGGDLPVGTRSVPIPLVDSGVYPVGYRWRGVPHVVYPCPYPDPDPVPGPPHVGRVPSALRDDWFDRSVPTSVDGLLRSVSTAAVGATRCGRDSVFRVETPPTLGGEVGAPSILLRLPGGSRPGHRRSEVSRKNSRVPPLTPRVLSRGSCRRRTRGRGPCTLEPTVSPTRLPQLLELPPKGPDSPGYSSVPKNVFPPSSPVVSPLH